MQEIKCLKPQELVKELDKYIIGQTEAKKAVAVALRNRYRRKLIEKPLRDEIVPKNILMIGPTGVGKTEIARRIAKLTDAPFVKVEATNFTEVGYVGKDVDSIIKDLVDVSVKKERKKAKEENEVKAKEIAKNKIIDIMLEIIPDDSKEKEKEKKKMIELFDKGELFDKDIEIDIAEQPKSFIDQIDFPEGSAVSLPLRREGLSRKKAFFLGSLSGIVEPISALIGAILVLKVQFLLPILLSFAGGAMIYVVIQELIPESQTNKKKNLMALFTILGFVVMMIFDVALG